MEKTYNAPGITVYYNPRLCVHAAECARGLPQVFDTSKKPWIQPEHAAPDAVAEVIQRCPSGALRFERLDDGTPENIPNKVTGTFVENGPLYLRGAIKLTDSEGQTLFEGSSVALCRCGASKNKPFCDRSHKEIGFQAAGGGLEATSKNKTL